MITEKKIVDIRGSLNKNDLLKLIYLNTWTSEGNMFGKIRRIRRCCLVGAGTTLLEESVTGVSLRFQKPIPDPVSIFSAACV